MQRTVVSEKEINEAMVWAMDKHQMYIEGAGAATIAGIRKFSNKMQGKIAGIITGQNISLSRFYSVLKHILEGN